MNPNFADGLRREDEMRTKSLEIRASGGCRSSTLKLKPSHHKNRTLALSHPSRSTKKFFRGHAKSVPEDLLIRQRTVFERHSLDFIAKEVRP
jgi:hypothetical protein